MHKPFVGCSKTYIVVCSKDAAASISNSEAHVPGDCICIIHVLGIASFGKENRPARETMHYRW